MTVGGQRSHKHLVLRIRLQHFGQNQRTRNYIQHSLAYETAITTACNTSFGQLVCGAIISQVLICAPLTDDRKLTLSIGVVQQSGTRASTTKRGTSKVEYYATGIGTNSPVHSSLVANDNVGRLASTTTNHGISSSSSSSPKPKPKLNPAVFFCG
jgi:hypothetical protein